jgi:hypothetical protein
LHVDPIDEELHDPRLLGGKQLAPDRGKSASSTVTSRSVMSSSPSRFAVTQVRATNSGAASSFWTWSSTAPSTSAAARS